MHNGYEWVFFIIKLVLFCKTKILKKKSFAVFKNVSYVDRTIWKGNLKFFKTIGYPVLGYFSSSFDDMWNKKNFINSYG